ncbi:MAG: DUF58 domain-containing protein [Ilumatobacter sp.]|nr:DUF58 domain-containing protein [Ilumatobacter sp.]
MAAGQPTTARIALPPRRDERWATAAAVSGVALLLGVWTGDARFAALAVPFVVLATVVGRRATDAPVAVRVALADARCLEGDRVEGVIEIAAPADLDVEIALDPDPASAITAPDDERWAWWIPIEVDRPVGSAFTVEARRWGEHRLGPLRLRLTRPGSGHHHEIVLADLPSLTVLPREIPRTEVVRLTTARAAAGAHAARRPAPDGYEFAEVRGYHAGDRLRDLNWAATLRRGEPHVTRRVPELAGDLVIVVDGFPDALRRHSEIATESIAWSGRLAWSLANQHLRANDRVGIVVDGAKVRWIPPMAGRRARLDVFRTLLAYASSTVDGSDPSAPPDRLHLPAGALVLAITPLARRHTIERLAAWRAAGHRVDVVAIDIDAMLTARCPSLPDEIVGLHRLDFDTRVRALRRRGIGVRVASLPVADGAGAS